MFQHGAKAVCARPSPLINAERRKWPSRKHLLLEYVCILQANGSCNQGKVSSVNDCTRRCQVQPPSATALPTGESAPTSNEVPQTRQTAQVHLHLRFPSARSTVIHDLYICIFPHFLFFKLQRFAIPLSEPRCPGCYRHRHCRLYTRTGSILCYCPCSTSPSVATTCVYICMYVITCLHSTLSVSLSA
jgi:hypothetical protein